MRIDDGRGYVRHNAFLILFSVTEKKLTGAR